MEELLTFEQWYEKNYRAKIGTLNDLSITVRRLIYSEYDDYKYNLLNKNRRELSLRFAKGG